MDFSFYLQEGELEPFFNKLIIYDLGWSYGEAA